MVFSDLIKRWERSGKLVVVDKLLTLWQSQGHKTLIFVQTKQMLDILEAFLVQKDFSYYRLDGSVAIQKRMQMIDEFNHSDIMAFILTTKVGGIGINLTGANRVILYEPDWNPSTDIQGMLEELLTSKLESGVGALARSKT